MPRCPNFVGGATVIFDTDIFIWIQRGNAKAALLVERETERVISVQTYMELLQCARDKQQHACTRAFLKDFGFRTLPLHASSGRRASRVASRESIGARPATLAPRPTNGRLSKSVKGIRLRVASKKAVSVKSNT